MLSVHKALPLAVLVVVASLLVANRARRRPPEEGPRLDDWDVPRLVDHLSKQGLELRVVSTQNRSTSLHNAYLTTTDKKWGELNHMLKVPEQAEGWRGTLYVERSHDTDVRAFYWGDCCLVAGPFVFFGDRDLLARVRAVLSKS
jgi:hypothetical protein